MKPSRVLLILTCAALVLGSAASSEAAWFLAGMSQPQNNSIEKAESSDPPVSHNRYVSWFYGAYWSYGTSHRGTLSLTVGAYKRQPNLWRGVASFRFDDVVFTCDDNRSQVDYRQRLTVSTSIRNSAGATARLAVGEPAPAYGSGATWGGWGNTVGGTGPLAGIPAGPGFSATTITGPLRTAIANAPKSITVGITSETNRNTVITADGVAEMVALATFPTDGPVFELPEGCSCNSAEGNIVNNMWMGTELPPPTVAVSGTVTGDCSGPLAGVQVTLVDGNGATHTTITDADGVYSLPAVASSATATGLLTIATPAGYEPVDPQELTLSTDVTFDASLMCSTVEVVGALTSDCDGPLAGVEVTLVDGDGASHTATTVADGSYAFPDIAHSENPGQVSVAVPAGYAAPGGASAAVDLSVSSSRNFALECVVVDVAGSVTSDCGGALEGAAVTLVDGNGVEQTTVTAADGSYLFAGISYSAIAGQVSVAVPAGYTAPGGSSAAIDLTANAGQDFALVCALVDVTGTVTSICGGPLSGVTVDLLDAGGDFHTTSTDAAGAYTFADLPYSEELDGGEVSIAIPLGYEAIAPGVQGAALTLNQDRAVNFSLDCLNPTGPPRSMGYWKHQANVYLSNKGHAQESSADMETNYPQALFNHFHENQLNGIQVEGVTYIVSGGSHVPISLVTIQGTLTVNKGGTMLDRARQQYLALLLNVASGKLRTSTVVSEDGATVSQALQQVALHITDGSAGNDEVAKDIGEIINNAGLVPAGIIDLNINSIAYRRGAGEGTLLLGPSPSPFTLSTSIRFRLDTPGEASVGVFDATGRLVRRLHDGWIQAGQHEVAWNGDSESGRQSASGVYYIRLVSAGRSFISKAVILR